VKLTSLAAPSPAHRSAAASVNRRRPPLLAAGKPRPAVPKPIRPTTTLLSTSPSYPPPFPSSAATAVAGTGRRRPPSAASSVLAGQGPDCLIAKVPGTHLQYLVLFSIVAVNF